MAKTVKAPVNAEVLAWARKTACVSVEEAAAAAAVDPERIKSWEIGEDLPTLPMLRKLAIKYKRPLAVMLLREPPRDFQALRDFRRLSGNAAPMPPRVAYEIRAAQERREIALEIMREGDDLPAPFTLAASIDENVEQVAERFRQFFAVTQIEQETWARRDKVFDGWRGKLEAKGVLVFVMGGSQGPLVRHVRGFAIPADALPIVAVNGRDKTNGRTFSLLHECVHLALRQAVVENETTSYNRLPPADRAVEKFCNAVAAATLMPAQAMADLATKLSKGPQSEWTDYEVQSVADRLGVSREAMLIRAVGLGFASARFYLQKRGQFAAEYARMDEPSDKSIPVPPYKTVVGRYGRTFARSVLSGYQERRITMNDAAAFLNVQAKHLDFIARQTFREV